jgi:hypothetical protein
MKKLILSLSMVAFAVALQAGEGKDCAAACASKTAKAATCDKATAKATSCDKATAKATCCADKQARKADATAKGATQLAKR